MRLAPFSFKREIMALSPAGLVVAGYGLPELTTGFIRIDSPRESQEKSVADSAASRTAAKSPLSETPRVTPAKLTLTSGPDLRTFSAARTSSCGIAAAAKVRLITLRNLRRFMLV